MKHKIFKKIFSLITVFVILFSSLSSGLVSYSFATDSPEEILREQEEAEREAQQEAEKAARKAQRQAEEAAREQAEAEREALEDATPTPTQVPQPTTAQPDQPDPETTTAVASQNADTGETEENGSVDSSTSSVSDSSVDNNNSSDLNNNVETNSNTGNNVISGDDPPSPTPTTTSEKEESLLPQCEDNLADSANIGGEEDSFSQENGELDSQNSQASEGESKTESEVDTSAESDDQLTVVNSNCASVKNDQEISAVSGENDSSNNEGATVNTGDALAKSNLVNQANGNTTDGSSEDALAGESETNDRLTVNNDNQIYAENNVSVEATSGGNTLNDNDGQANLTTGDIDMMVTLLNILNTNITGEDFTHLIVNIFGDLNGEVDLDKIAANLGMSDEDLQAIARNEMTEAERNELTVENNNQAQVENNVDVKGVSGNNEVSGNDDGARVLTGRIKILVALINFINTNYSGTDWYFAMVNIFGNLEGDIVLPDPNSFLVDSSQTSSQEESEQNSTEETDVANTNKATVNNNVEVSGDSGSNTAYANEDRVNQDTGDVNLSTNLMNWLNVNIVGDNWVLLVINVFGKWYGQIVGFPGSGTLDAPDSGTLMLAAGGVSGSGPTVTDEDSQSGLQENNDTLAVSNDNSATVDNNVKVEGVSGGNTTNQNQDGVSLSTGWIDISADLLNIVNMNVSGKHWMLVLVNIFGNFMGDITFPGAKNTLVSEFTTEAAKDTTIVQTQTGLEGQEEASETEDNPGEKIIVLANSLPSSDYETKDLSVNKVNEEETPKIEVFKANSYSQENSQEEPLEDNNTVKILGVSVDNSRRVQQTLFLVALISYLIALRFWAFRKNS